MSTRTPTTDAEIPNEADQSITTKSPLKVADAVVVERTPVKDALSEVTKEPKKSAESEKRDSSRDSHDKIITLTSADDIPLQQRIPVQVFIEEPFVQKWGTIIAAILTGALTFAIFNYGRILSEQQLVLQEQQTKVLEEQATLQKEQAQAETADIRSKFLDNLIDKDDNKKTLAEIGLAGHDQKAWPVIHLAMGVEQTEIHDSAVNVVYRLFQSKVNTEERENLLTYLLSQEFKSPNKNVRLGVVQSLVKIEPLLDSTERQRVTTFLESSVTPQGMCIDETGRETIKHAALFISLQNTSPTTYLTAIARCPQCGDAWLQAMFRLRDVGTHLSLENRSKLQKEIEQAKTEVLTDLRKNISDESLATGAGFAQFFSKGKFSLDFKELERRVGEEFDTLIHSLDMQ